MLTLVDIGSTIVKIASLDESGALVDYRRCDRDFETSIYAQLSRLLEQRLTINPKERFRICSSANGGLRVGIVCLTTIFSGNIARSLALAAGGNVLFVHNVVDMPERPPEVDALIVVGGIDCADADHMRDMMANFSSANYKYQTLVYSGNKFLTPEFTDRFPHAQVVPNSLGFDMQLASEDLLEKIRDLYLDDLVHKQGVSKLQPFSEVPIWPTPAVVNMAAQHLGHNGSNVDYPSPYIILDIGGATTDVHFGLEVLDGDGSARPTSYRTFNRHVFTDLGVFASRDSSAARLSENSRLFEFLRVLKGNNVNEAYSDVREGIVSRDLLFYGCFFLALDSLARKNDKSSPTLRIGQINSIVITGGASQVVERDMFSKITRIFLGSARSQGIPVYLDSGYEIWTEGMKHLPLVSNA